MVINDISNKIKKEGFCFLEGKEVLNYITESESFNKLSKEYNQLPLDKYTRKCDGQRYRRFGRLLFDPKSRNIIPLKSSIFYQNKNINKRYGGIKRKFSPINKNVLNNKFIRDFVFFNFNNLPLSRNHLRNKLEIGIHLIRIVSKANVKGKPAPEGVHQDGHDFISISLIKRENIKGGISKIFDKNKHLVETKMLKSRLDSIYIDDKKMFHYASTFNPINKKKDGIRDILIMDLNLYDNKGSKI